MTDWLELRGQTALVTGAALRLGRFIALALAREGVSVAVHYRSSETEAEALADEIRGLGAGAWTFQADLARPEDAGLLVNRAVEETGGLDILVNSAGIFPETDFSGTTAAAVHENVDINALSPLYAARAFAAQGRPGSVVNLLDTMIADYDRKHVPYHLSKRMLFTLTRIMAVEFAPSIRVNAVAPGLVLPPPGKDQSYLEGLAHTNPLNRFGSGDGVAQAVLFLLRSGFVTGQVIYVDGGRRLRGGMYG